MTLEPLIALTNDNAIELFQINLKFERTWKQIMKYYRNGRMVYVKMGFQSGITGFKTEGN